MLLPSNLFPLRLWIVPENSSWFFFFFQFGQVNRHDAKVVIEAVPALSSGTLMRGKKITYPKVTML